METNGRVALRMRLTLLTTIDPREFASHKVILLRFRFLRESLTGRCLWMQEN